MFCGDGGAMCIYIVWCEEGRTSHLVWSAAACSRDVSIEQKTQEAKVFILRQRAGSMISDLVVRNHSNKLRLICDKRQEEKLPT
jgi:hypothetical protein